MFGWFGFGRMRTIKCPDGTVHTIYKNVNDAFPLFLEGWEGDLSARVKAENNLDATIDGGYKSTINGILIALDDFNNSIIADFRTAYVIYQGNPCGNADHIRRIVEKSMDKRDLLREKKMLLDALIQLVKTQPSNKEEFLKLSGNILEQLLPKQAVFTTITALEIAEKTAHEMAGKPK